MRRRKALKKMTGEKRTIGTRIDQRILAWLKRKDEFRHRGKKEKGRWESRDSLKEKAEVKKEGIKEAAQKDIEWGLVTQEEWKETGPSIMKLRKKKGKR